MSHAGTAMSTAIAELNAPTGVGSERCWVAEPKRKNTRGAMSPAKAEPKWPSAAGSGDVRLLVEIPTEYVWLMA